MASQSPILSRQNGDVIYIYPCTPIFAVKEIATFCRLLLQMEKKGLPNYDEPYRFCKIEP